MENFNLLRQSYHWGKYINEAQTKAGINLTDEGIPREPDTPSKPKSESTQGKYSVKQKQLYKHYKDYKKSIWNSRQNIKQLKKEIREEDTEMIHQWNEAQREKDPKYVSNLDNLKRRLRKEQGIVDRMVRSLEAIEEKYPDLLHGSVNPRQPEELKREEDEMRRDAEQRKRLKGTKYEWIHNRPGLREEE